MTERIRRLLDDAVDQLEPRDMDPVGSVLRRERTAKRRTLTAGLGVAALTVGAITAGGLAINRPETGPPEPPQTAGPIADAPPVPRTLDGTVTAGTLEMRIPGEWKALDDGERERCDPAPGRDTVVVVHTGVDGCRLGIEVSGRVPRMPDPPPAMITLPGGEPAWLGEPSRSRNPRTRQLQYRTVMVMPWSLVTYELFADNPGNGQLLRPSRTAPIRAGVLTLPETAAHAYLSGPDVQAELADSTAIARLMQALHAATDVVENADACANVSQETLQITLLPGGTAQPPEPSDPAAFRVVIALGTCQEAVSSHGGRVRLTDTAVTELKTIFRIGAR
ncbi:hypothetical protein [Actinoplanes sp. CA-252034]|uniref:hypothetical protein n=1 Tax=Actinoplanes sp. CA-252034 TaxID=3239906 RepID=UPI003D9544B8